MMKLLLSLAISVWVGWGGGAITENAVPSFWIVWSIIGVILAVITTIYIYERRMT